MSCSVCFNHRVVTLVADKLETERFTLVCKTNWIRQRKKQPPCSSYNHNTLRIIVKESLQMHFKVAVRGFDALNVNK